MKGTIEAIESVWDYPRPPKLEIFKGHIRIIHKGIIVVDSNQARRILETSHPPTYYIPLEDINMKYFRMNKFSTFCEYKGHANYLDLNLKEDNRKNVGWYYKSPNRQYEELTDCVSFYASKFDHCYVNDEEVQSQEGDFYGGWITKNIKGPFKGSPGTFGW